MDNESSSPQIQFPNVPDDFCPTGNWQEVLQQFIDIVLSNGTINVPGLGDVTPAQIQTINAELASQQNQINALDTRVDTLDTQVTTLNTQVTTLNTQVTTLDTRVDALEELKIQRGNITGVADNDSTQAVTLPTAFPSANYNVLLTPIIPGGGIGANAPIIGIQSGTKTASGFTISIQNNGTAPNIDVIEWMAIHP
jgi:outer membrane murein-binding lipoprotein Lpp